MDCGKHACPVLEFPVSRRSRSLFQGAAFTLLLWAGSAEIGGPLDLSHLNSPECVWPRWLCLEFVAIGTDPQLDITRYGKGGTYNKVWEWVPPSPPCLLI